MAQTKGQKRDELNPKQRLFIQYYTDKTAQTFGNSYLSYVKAGYSNKASSKVSACQLLSKPKIKQEIQDLLNKQVIQLGKNQEVNAEYALKCLTETYSKALEVGDITNQVACIRLMMQKCGLLQERIVVDLTDSRQLEQSLISQAKQIASIILSDEQSLLCPAQSQDTLYIDTQSSPVQAITVQDSTEHRQSLIDTELTE